MYNIKLKTRPAEKTLETPGIKPLMTGVKPQGSQEFSL